MQMHLQAYKLKPERDERMQTVSAANKQLHQPEDVLTHCLEPGDVFVVDDVSVKGGLSHQVGPGEGGVHQRISWKVSRVSFHQGSTTSK